MINRFVGSGFPRLLVAVALASGLLVDAGTARAAEYGVLGLYAVEDAESYEAALRALEDDMESQYCNVRRAGKIVSQAGGIFRLISRLNVGTPNRFLFLTCRDPHLRAVETRALLQELDRGAERVALLEGEATIFPEAHPSQPQGRDYILKVSHYNNDDPDGRDRDLASLGAATSSRPDTYKIEAFIAVSHAVGMETPDEVFILFYDTPEQGNRFRKNNPEILAAIDTFNERHLSDFVYYSAVADR